MYFCVVQFPVFCCRLPDGVDAVVLSLCVFVCLKLMYFYTGKTALVDTIAGRRHKGEYSGTISNNGATMKHTNIAYCQNIDIHLAEFTIMQHLYYACQLRLGSKLSSVEIEKQCTLTAAAVGLTSVLDRYSLRYIYTYIHVVLAASQCCSCAYP
jgi:hypothetical protein